MAKTKPQGQWTYEDLFDLPDDGKRYEIIDGVLYELPTPFLAHASAIANLISALAPMVRPRGWLILTGPLDVFIPGGDPVEPDLLVLLPERRHFIRDHGIDGPPDLLIEVLDPGHPNLDHHDCVTKRTLYASAGVPEYWIVNPEAATVETLALEGATYRTYCRAGGDQPVISRVLPELNLVASAVFDLPEQATANER